MINPVNYPANSDSRIIVVGASDSGGNARHQIEIGIVLIFLGGISCTTGLDIETLLKLKLMH